MNKLATRARRASNDKGFSLIELVIVIAIMAALIAILAPQYLKYVEKSRVTADETCAAEILSACKVAASDPDVALGTGTYTAAWNGGTTLTYNAAATAVTDFTDAVDDAIGDLPTIKSAEYNGRTYTVTITVGSGSVTAEGEWSDAT